MRNAILGTVLILVGIIAVNLSIYTAGHWTSERFERHILVYLPVSIMVCLAGATFTTIAVYKDKYFAKWHFVFLVLVPLLCYQPFMLIPAVANFVWILWMLLQNRKSYIDEFTSKQKHD